MTNSRMAYTVTHEAHYWPAIRSGRDGRLVAEVIVMCQPLENDGRPAGGVVWEFIVSWLDLRSEPAWRAGREEPPAAQIEIFNDAWQAFHEIPEFFGLLTSLGDRATPDAVQAALQRLGWVDITMRSDRAAS